MKELKLTNAEGATILHNIASALQTLLKIGYILTAMRIRVFLRFALQTLYPDFVRSSAMPPPETLDFDGIDVLVINVPFPIADCNRCTRVGKMEVWQINLNRRVMLCW